MDRYRTFFLFHMALDRAFKEFCRRITTDYENILTEYAHIKTTYETRRKEFEVTKIELDQTRSVYAHLLKHKKALQHEHHQLVMTSENMSLRIKHLDGVVEKKDQDILDLVNKVNETVRLYEEKLEQKDEQVWILSEKIRGSMMLCFCFN